MSVLSWFLFCVPICVWSTTFFVITLQLNSPTTLAYAVALRFMCAAVLLFVWLFARREPIRLSRTHHAITALSGVFAYGVSYVLTYLSELVIPSGLVAIAFTLLVFLTPLFARLVHGTAITRQTLIGGSLGILGVALIFAPGLMNTSAEKIAAWGVGAMLIAAFVSAIAAMLSIQLNKEGAPVITYTAWAMLYGASATFIYAIIAGQVLVLDHRPSFWFGFVYLTLAGTIVAFLCYLTLLKREGAARTMYISVLSPVGALMVSVLFERLRPSLLTWIGVAVALLGAWYTLSRKSATQSA
jgi:drug/metabolite transporter (DMT)-like permease